MASAGTYPTSKSTISRKSWESFTARQTAIMSTRGTVKFVRTIANITKANFTIQLPARLKVIAMWRNCNAKIDKKK